MLTLTIDGWSEPATLIATLTFFSYWPAFLGCLAVALLVSGIDDLGPVLICGSKLWRRRKTSPAVSCEPSAASGSLPERLIAIFVPCWRESEVIADMVRHNLAAIRYRNFHFFLGVYPNDEATVNVASALEAEFGNVHVAKCPHAGPTSKADCLNWAYQSMLLFERVAHARFDTIVLHDAEDMIHPDALSLINRERVNNAMVQVPVLPVRTGFGEVTHGIYCDEFAEFQTIDMRARDLSGAFVPSNGVGTGFARVILEQLAKERNEMVFDPASLTEDYEIGLYIHAAGYAQKFVPLQRGPRDFVATREYFPRTVQTAIRQRTRWITGIALQTWERHGWRGNWSTRYWFWRDRKGLITNPLSVLANALFVLGLLDYAICALLRRPRFFEIQDPVVAALCIATMSLQCFRLALRAACVGRIFGLSSALGVPLRSFHANLVNCIATMRAVHSYFHARQNKKTLVWQKTDHLYPRRETLHAHRRELAEVLTGYGYVSQEQVSAVQNELANGSTLDLLLLAKGIINEEKLCKAMSLQSGLPAVRVDARKINPRVAQSLPAHIQKRHGLRPFEVRSGRLLVASAQVPTEEALEEVKSLTQIPVDFQLVTKSNYQELQETP